MLEIIQRCITWPACVNQPARPGRTSAFETVIVLMLLLL
jgi:hypothetical protein